MARYTPTDEQQAIIRLVKEHFDTKWEQATGPETINFDVHKDDFEELESFLEHIGYDLWMDWQDLSRGYKDVSFKSE